MIVAYRRMNRNWLIVDGIECNSGTNKDHINNDFHLMNPPPTSILTRSFIFNTDRCSMHHQTPRQKPKEKLIFVAFKSTFFIRRGKLRLLPTYDIHHYHLCDTVYGLRSTISEMKYEQYFNAVKTWNGIWTNMIES